ncbi:MAG: zf-HC2 domain-containing protein [Calditrichaeota bacterium]|nr:MAG: zf-HC2 domain-containing protein [Calditrichota bacterium]
MIPSKNEGICGQFEQKIWLFLDHDLPEIEIAFWQQHLEKCKNCAGKMEEIASVNQAYAGLPTFNIANDELNSHISRAVTTVKLSQRNLSPVPDLFKKLGAILLPLAVVIMFYLRLNPVEREMNFSWEPMHYQETITAIDSAIFDLESDPLWADVGESNWDIDSNDLEYHIEQISEDLIEYP